ncbi:hypothetical protein Z968_10175 [Clostridium novyi A str. 4552]|uniref:Uncharacterized protein n=1 Tax=Clostridium novyi A str. 4552 TaxID=1444289 RepID=A0A0A0I0N4_CLONO|nr:hypothetical protein [Clostridium novyi]KGM95004.1 hypothetical protein Z968_10175 [Clostridium novyi A str. 4552]
MKLEEKQKWYMTERWKDCICNCENYNWNDNFIWGDGCEYNDGFQWGCDDDWNLVHSNCEIDDCEVEENIVNGCYLEDGTEIEEDTEKEEDYEEDIQYVQGPQEQQPLASQWINDTCVEPIKHVLEQLMENDVADLEVGIEKQGTILNCRIVSIEKSVVKFQTSDNYVLVPIYQIVGIYTNSIKNITLMSAEESDNDIDCNCCEGDLRECLSSETGKMVRVNTRSGDELFRTLTGNITRIGKGIVVLNEKLILTTTKIVSVEEDLD